MRPTYETEQDRAREARVGQYLSDRWACQVFKLKPYYGVDYAVFTEGRMRGVMEIKCRTYTSQQLDGMGGLILSAHKWANAAQWHSVHKMAFVLALDLPDGLFTLTVTPDDAWPVYPLILGGRTDRGDEHDIEPCCLIPMSGFVLQA